jgi:hypothetical protein
MNKDAKEPLKSESSMVKSIGTAGTSMAFVPTAALNRRRNNKRPAPAAPSSISFVQPPQRQYEEQLLSSEEPKASTSTLATGWSVHVDEAQPHSDPASSDTIPASVETHEVKHTDDRLNDLQKLVSEDPYDPMVPNDLLQYWENKALSVERERLEREACETLEEQQRLRQQLEREREELQKSGDVDRLVEYHTKRSMGRGRGLSNLPAWLVEKQRKEREVGNDVG